jgi:hypothetical protein
MTQPDPRAEVLRAAGHGEAADLLERLNALEQPQAEASEEQEAETPTATQDSREAEGRALLEAMRRDLGDGGRAGSVPFLSGPAQ